MMKEAMHSQCHFLNIPQQKAIWCSVCLHRHDDKDIKLRALAHFQISAIK